MRQRKSDGPPKGGTVIIKVDPVKPDPGKMREAAGFVKRGDVVVFPTETVYGIGASALDPSACSAIFRIKGRPADNPLIVHVSSMDMARKVGRIPPKYERALLAAWPCPLTLIVEAMPGIPDAVTAGLKTVALRMPAHPVALALIDQAGVPIAAPSANPSKKPSATNGSQAIKYFDGEVGCIIDAGRSFFGVESTIIDTSSFTVLRPGPFTIEEIGRIFGEKPRATAVTKGMKSADSPISPGTKYAHYAPETPLLLSECGTEALLDMLAVQHDIPEFAFIGSGESCAAVAKETGCSTIALGDAGNLYEVAKNLYDGLILLDSLKVGFGIIESFPESGIGLAIMNRIRKASSGMAFRDEEQLSSLLYGIVSRT